MTGSATNSALTAVENKITNVSNLITKTGYNTKVSEIEKKVSDHNYDKYITTREFNKLTTENFKARLAQSNLITKTNLGTELKKISDRVTSNKTKHLLVENELKKLKTVDSSCFKCKSHFEEDGTQNYLIFQPIQRYFKKGLQVLVVVIIYTFGNLKVYLMKGLILILHVTAVLLQN